jgi:hypothetical protein
MWYSNVQAHFDEETNVSKLAKATGSLAVQATPGPHTESPPTSCRGDISSQLSDVAVNNWCPIRQLLYFTPHIVFNL